MGKVRRPVVNLDARGQVATHGYHTPVRGIWHDTESHDAKGLRDLQAIVDFWKRQDRGYGAQLIIDKDGNSCLCSNFNKITWHTGGRNTGSIGIELVGFASFSNFLWRLRFKQLDKLARWMAYLNLRFKIPIRFNVDNGWSGHRDQPNQSHTDPGIFFPASYVLKRARYYRENGW